MPIQNVKITMYGGSCLYCVANACDDSGTCIHNSLVSFYIKCAPDRPWGSRLFQRKSIVFYKKTT